MTAGSTSTGRCTVPRRVQPGVRRQPVDDPSSGIPTTAAADPARVHGCSCFQALTCDLMAGRIHRHKLGVVTQAIDLPTA